MNWDAIGAIGEIIGAIAVVISVFYLAIQVRKQTHESRLSATRELSAQYIDFQAVVAEDNEISRIWLQAVADYESLPDEERLRASIIFQRALRILEQQYLHTSSGNVDSSYFKSINDAFGEWFTFPGVLRWWELSKHMFDQNFQEYVQELMDEGAQKNYQSTFNTKNGNLA